MKSVGKSEDTEYKEPIPIGEGFFEFQNSKSGKPYLVGSQCKSCGEVFFPIRTCCRRCASEKMQQGPLSQIAKLYSFTKIRVKPPHFIGDVPYLVGVVELPEGERIRTLLTDCDLDSLKIGMEMELVIESVGKTKQAMGKIDPETEALGWKFRPKRKV